MRIFEVNGLKFEAYMFGLKFERKKIIGGKWFMHAEVSQYVHLLVTTNT